MAANDTSDTLSPGPSSGDCEGLSLVWLWSVLSATPEKDCTDVRTARMSELGQVTGSLFSDQSWGLRVGARSAKLVQKPHILRKMPHTGEEKEIRPKADPRGERG